jgi:hypothetical protein
MDQFARGVIQDAGMPASYYSRLVRDIHEFTQQEWLDKLLSDWPRGLPDATERLSVYHRYDPALKMDFWPWLVQHRFRKPDYNPVISPAPKRQRLELPTLAKLSDSMSVAWVKSQYEKIEVYVFDGKNWVNGKWEALVPPVMLKGKLVEEEWVPNTATFPNAAEFKTQVFDKLVSIEKAVASVNDATLLIQVPIIQGLFVDIEKYVLADRYLAQIVWDDIRRWRESVLSPLASLVTEAQSNTDQDEAYKEETDRDDEYLVYLRCLEHAILTKLRVYGRVDRLQELLARMTAVRMSALTPVQLTEFDTLKIDVMNMVDDVYRYRDTDIDAQSVKFETFMAAVNLTMVTAPLPVPTPPPAVTPIVAPATPPPATPPPVTPPATGFLGGIASLFFPTSAPTVAPVTTSAGALPPAPASPASSVSSTPPPLIPTPPPASAPTDEKEQWLKKRKQEALDVVQRVEGMSRMDELDVRPFIADMLDHEFTPSVNDYEGTWEDKSRELVSASLNGLLGLEEVAKKVAELTKAETNLIEKLGSTNHDFGPARLGEMQGMVKKWEMNVQEYVDKLNPDDLTKVMSDLADLDGLFGEVSRAIDTADAAQKKVDEMDNKVASLGIMTPKWDVARSEFDVKLGEYTLAWGPDKSKLDIELTSLEGLLKDIQQQVDDVEKEIGEIRKKLEPQLNKYPGFFGDLPVKYFQSVDDLKMMWNDVNHDLYTSALKDLGDAMGRIDTIEGKKDALQQRLDDMSRTIFRPPPYMTEQWYKELALLDKQLMVLDHVKDGIDVQNQLEDLSTFLDAFEQDLNSKKVGLEDMFARFQVQRVKYPHWAPKWDAFVEQYKDHNEWKDDDYNDWWDQSVELSDLLDTMARIDSIKAIKARKQSMTFLPPGTLDQLDLLLSDVDKKLDIENTKRVDIDMVMASLEDAFNDLPSETLGEDIEAVGKTYPLVRPFLEFRFSALPAKGAADYDDKVESLRYMVTHAKLLNMMLERADTMDYIVSKLPAEPVDAYVDWKKAMDEFRRYYREEMWDDKDIVKDQTLLDELTKLFDPIILPTLDELDRLEGAFTHLLPGVKEQLLGKEIWGKPLTEVFGLKNRFVLTSYSNLEPLKEFAKVIDQINLDEVKKALHAEKQKERDGVVNVYRALGEFLEGVTGIMSGGTSQKLEPIIEYVSIIVESDLNDEDVIRLAVKKLREANPNMFAQIGDKVDLATLTKISDVIFTHATTLREWTVNEDAARKFASSLRGIADNSNPPRPILETMYTQVMDELKKSTKISLAIFTTKGVNDAQTFKTDIDRIWLTYKSTIQEEMNANATKLSKEWLSSRVIELGTYKECTEVNVNAMASLVRNLDALLKRANDTTVGTRPLDPSTVEAKTPGAASTGAVTAAPSSRTGNKKKRPKAVTDLAPAVPSGAIVGTPLPAVPPAAVVGTTPKEPSQGLKTRMGVIRVERTPGQSSSDSGEDESFDEDDDL